VLAAEDVCDRLPLVVADAELAVTRAMPPAVAQLVCHFSNLHLQELVR
jgi:hypothetical protein